MADNAQFPLRGVILCCTSIPPEQRSDLAAIAEQMGAIHKFDLTSDVTHLIVGDTDTPKYKFVAKERFDVKVLLPDWLAAVRASWLEGGTTDVAALEVEHRLPTFYGLRICVTGFEDLILRKRLEDEVRLNGGEYRGNLTKDVTHLIAKEPTGQKYNYAKQWEIKTVSVEWHEQSLERGMILDENLYNPLLPAVDRGRGAWIQRSVSTTSLGKRAREGDAGPQNARKLRRTTSAKFVTHNDNLWTDIVSAEVKSAAAKVDDWDDQPPVKRDGKILAQSGPQTIKQDSIPERGKTALQRTQSLGSLDSLLAKPAQQEGFFKSTFFFVQGFDSRKTSILETHLRSHGAVLVRGSLELVPDDGGYFLVPHTMTISEVEGLIGTQHLPQAVTDLWIERCLFYKRRERPLEHVLSTPYYNAPILKGLTVNSTGFEGIARSQLAKVVHLLGATYEETFAEETFVKTESVLVCNATTPDHPKLRHAQLWGVPAVSPDWLWDSVRCRESLTLDRYLLQAITPSNIPKKEDLPFLRTAEDVRAERTAPKLATTERSTMKASSKTLSNGQHDGSNRGYRKLSSSGRISNSSANIFPDDTGPRLEPYHVEENASLSKSDSLGRSMLTRNGQVLPEKPSSPKGGAGHTKSTLSLQESRKQCPLQEVSPNSSPPKPPSSNIKAIKAPQSPVDNLKTSKAAYDDETLGSAISSLLSHHQKQRSSNTTKPTTDQSSDPTTSQPYRRRRRTLLGRAPSNISSHSHNMQLSRASSIDTLNTDGVGTPISLSDFKAPDGKSDRLKAIYDDSHEDPDKPDDEDLRMTQLGYEDPNVAAWRERVAIKMGGGKVKDSVTPGRVKKVAPEHREPAGGDGGLGISRRTRAAVGGR